MFVDDDREEEALYEKKRTSSPFSKRRRRREEDVMGQTCSTPGEKEARDEDEEEEKVLEDDDDFGGCSAKRWCSSPLDVGKDFLRFEKSSVEEEERRDGRERGTKEVREERAPFFLPRRKGRRREER